MSRVTYVSLAPGQEELYYQALKPRDRFILSSVSKNKRFFSREKVAGLTRQSFLPAIAALWKVKSAAEKLAWKNAGAERGVSGWQAFIADQSQRIKFGLPGEATPSTKHQDYVGYINIEAPASEIKIAQHHPAQYWIEQKVAGTKSQYEPLSVEEKFYLPLDLTINIKSDLEAQSDASFAKYYADIRHFYQGQNLTSTLETDIPLSSDWTQITQNQANLRGEVSIYTLRIHLFSVRGWLMFDNPKSEHDAQNWTRDPYCKKIEQGFTRAFYQVEKAWSAETLPDGAEYYSAYPD